MDNFERKFVVFGTIGVLIFFATFVLINHLLGEVTRVFWWGFPMGLLLGVVTCMFISKTWDPVNLRPKTPKSGQDSKSVYWAVPLGVFAANIIVRVFSQEVVDLVLSVTLAWLFVTFIYIAFQVWRHSPR